MKLRVATLLLLLAAAGLTCIRRGGVPWSSVRARETGDYSAKVTDKYACFGIGWDDRRCAPYRRIDDKDFEYVRLLFAHDYACPVSDEDFVMVNYDAFYTCKWRHAR